MAMREISLVSKIALTQDVFELHYDFGEKPQMKPGQFITFILPGIGGRSYSVLDIQDNIVKLIIKRRSRENGGRGGSEFLCDGQIGDIYKCVGPVGHFVLQDNNHNKLFLGTGTGLVPLYNQILGGLVKKSGEKYQLVFGVRKMQDMFYMNEFAKLKEQFPDTFYYHLVVSRDEADGLVHKGYVTDFLSKKVVQDFGEYYICGAPSMIEGVLEKLKILSVPEEHIYYEKYA